MDGQSIGMAATLAIFVSTEYPPEMLQGSFVETRGRKKKPKAKGKAKPKAKGKPKASEAERASFFETMWKRERGKQRQAKSRMIAKQPVTEKNVIGISMLYLFSLV